MPGYHAKSGKSIACQGHVSRLGGAYAVTVLSNSGQAIDAWTYDDGCPLERVVAEGCVVHTVVGCSREEIDAAFRQWVEEDLRRQARRPVWSRLNAVTARR